MPSRCERVLQPSFAPSGSASAGTASARGGDYSAAAARARPLYKMCIIRVRRRFAMHLRALILALLVGGAIVAGSAQNTAAIQAPPGLRPGSGQADSSAGPAAYTCGVPTNPPAAAGRGAQPIFPPGQYPVSLPAVSLLGARNDLPNPYEPGVDWGQLPSGRKWGSTASVTTAPDGTIWVVDRCGNSGAGGTTCGGPSATVNPIFQLAPSGRVLKNFGAGMFVSPHKLTVDQ